MMKIPDLDKITGAIQTGQSCQIGGLWGSAYSLILSQIISGLPYLFILILPSIEEAESAVEDLSIFLPGPTDTISHFPFSETNDIIIEPDIFQERWRVLSSLSSSDYSKPIIVTSLAALSQKVPKASDFRLGFITLKTRGEIKVDNFIESLVKQGFSRVSEVTNIGEFSIRGGIVDVFPINLNEPVRIELFGNKVESLRTFNPGDQVSHTKLSQVELCLNKLGSQDSYLIDYLPDQTVVIYNDAFRIEEISQQEQETELINRLKGYQHINLQRLPVSFEAVNSFNFQITSLERFSGSLSGLTDELTILSQRGLRLNIFCTQSAEITRLKELISSGERAELDIRIKQGRLNQGFIFPEIGEAFISYNELFNRASTRWQFRARRPDPLASKWEPFTDLNEGDFVVHLKYGIGRYRGLQRVTRNKVIEECLVIEYHNHALVYVPVYQANLVEKYIGGSDRPPRLNEVGTNFWEIRKERVRQGVVRFARELLEIQAIRKTQQGIAFPEDTPWQTEFEASFPYEETPDQTIISEVIKKDMGSVYPMDRLICGDVGYGKTELAMRAAFKSATAGYQVAVLVPTTVLAQQHYQTFRERMADYPINIEMLCRLRSRPEQTAIVERIKEGGVDIIIGTHRLLQPDIKFKNLGLLILDEEQRFGVEHKERLKRLKATVDILTLTATPIPRTLHMSLVGVRDVSNLTTPPLDRRAVVTQIVHFEPSLIRNAIRRELDRNGQVYFVHNRICDIHKIVQQLKEIVPESRLTIAHGQLPEEDLSKRMAQFINHETDILVATNIIESGLDIPRVNTIFINEADKFGLADLHQLRGRVGRYKHQAYAYLIVSEGVIQDDAVKRLKTLAEFNELGAGFKIALRDMEIRGVGNILGREQHGHIATVGYDMYCRLLNEAKESLLAPSSTSLPKMEETPTYLALGLAAYLPLPYIPSVKHRLSLYHKISQAKNSSELTRIKSEIADRFGTPIPAEVENLLELAELKIHAGHLGFSSLVYVESDTFQNNPHIVGRTEKIETAYQIRKRYPKMVRLVDKNILHINLPKDSRHAVISILKKILR